MQTATFLGVLLAALFSLLLVLWQYYFRSGKKDKLTLALSVLRFIALFGVLLLLINPKISKQTFSTRKQNLVLLLDDSKSIQNSGASTQAREFRSALTGNRELAERFNFISYGFGQKLSAADSLNFDSDLSDISGALSSIENVYGRDKTLAILVSDGNQTLGKAYEYMGTDLSFPVYSLVVGDTTKYTDLKISRVNLNKYAFLNNSFPTEVFVAYQGKDEIKSRLRIRMDGRIVFSQDLDLNPRENSKKINTNLQASEVGFKTLEFTLDSIAGERNTENNRWRVPLEVIDEKTRIAIISEVSHPDIGAMIKAIESNQQRSVSLLKPQVEPGELSSYDLLILYQPGRAFEKVYEFLLQSGLNSFTLAGPGTDWQFLNRVQKGLEINNFNQTEEILPVVNQAFSLFDISDFSVEEFPPLRGSLGEILITRPYESILDQQIRGVNMQEPLLPVISGEEGRHAFLFGENIWKWRLQSFRNDQDFENFDRLINKIILFLTSDGKRDRLSVTYEQVYNAASDRTIKASYYDATFVFDSKAELKISVRGTDNDYSNQQNMVFSNTQYEADLSDLPPGEYTFSVTVEGEDLRSEGRFRVEDFNLEQLFVSSDAGKLERLSESSGGVLYHPDQQGQLIAEIMDEPRFSPTQKSVENVVSLIDFKVLLAVIVLALSLEWFIRKYNGLI